MYIGIDVGKKGGISFLDGTGEIIDLLPLPDQYDLSRMIYDHTTYLKQTDMFAVMEDVKARPGQGVTSMFTFGKGMGIIEGILVALRVPYALVRPQKWQSVMLSGLSKKSFPNPKERSLRAARQLYPDQTFIQPGCSVPHDGVYESLLLARYARHVHKTQNM